MMVNEPWANALPGDELNQKLQQLVKKAQQHPPKSVERRMALNSLAQEILSSGHLSRLRNSPCPPHLYEDFYNEALQKTLMEISQKIDGYNPKYPVMA